MLTPIVIIVVLIILLWIGRKLFSSGGLIGRMVATPGNDNRSTQVVGDIQQVRVDVALTSKTDMQIKQAADSQFQAFNNNGWGIFGTDENLMFDSLNGFNSEDLRGVYKAFGVREQVVLFVPVFKADLFGWYQSELSGSDLQKMKAIWAKTKMWS